MVLKAPKLPINVLFFILGTVCTIGYKCITTSIEVQANINMEAYNKTLLHSLESCGEIVVGKDVYICAKDITSMAERIIYERNRIAQLEEEYKLLKNEG